MVSSLCVYGHVNNSNYFNLKRLYKSCILIPEINTHHYLVSFPVQSKLTSDVEQLNRRSSSFEVASDVVQAILIPKIDKMDLRFSSLEQKFGSIHKKLIEVEKCAACNTGTVKTGMDGMTKFVRMDS